MMMKTLLIGEIHPDAEGLLKKNVSLDKITNERFLSEKYFPDVEAVVLRTFTKMGAAELEKFPRLRYVVLCSVGMDNMDMKELEKRKITLIHSPGTNANSVAEHVIYLLFSSLRTRSKTPFTELKNKTVGILGFGYIGKLVAKKLSGFEARLIAFDVIPQDQNILKELKVEMKDYDALLREADLITVHIPLNEYTKGMIDSASLKKIRSGSFLINTSRAEVINEKDLLAEFKSGRFKSLALDVYSDELKKQLEQLDQDHKVILTPHVAAQGEESFREMGLQPVSKFLKEIGKIL